MIDSLHAWWRGLGSGTRFLLGIWIAGSLAGLAFNFVPGVDPFAWIQLDGRAWRRFQVWRLPGHALVTSDLLNLLLGGFFLAWLGSAIERFWDRRWFLLYYLGCACGTAVGVALFAGPDAPFLGNAGPLIGLLVAWHRLQRHQRFSLFGGPEVSGGTAAIITALCLILPTLFTAGWPWALALAFGGLTGFVLLSLHTARGGRRARRENARPRMSRLEW